MNAIIRHQRPVSTDIVKIFRGIAKNSIDIAFTLLSDGLDSICLLLAAAVNVPCALGSQFKRPWSSGALKEYMSRTLGILASSLLLCGGCLTASSFAQSVSAPVLHAKTYNSHFPSAAGIGESYNGMGFASDGKLYYVIDSAAYNVPGQMYALDPKTGVISHIADLNTATGQGDVKAVAQGKSHVNFIESDGKLYFATHLGYYNRDSGVERTAAPPNGYLPYPGGHFLSYDLQTGKFESLAIAPRGEGIISFNMDVKRGRLYGITYPSGHFLSFDLASKRLSDGGAFFAEGESGEVGTTYRAICRRIVLDPRDGSVYFTTGDGAIHRYRYDTGQVETVPDVNLHKDYFGEFDPAKPGMAYNWRAAVWNPNDNCIYAVNGASGYLFRFDPAARTVEVLERLTSEPSRRAGMADKSGYGYLGLALDTRRNLLYYLTGSPLAVPAKTDEGSDLITFDISKKKYRDHGQIVLDTGAPAGNEQALVVANDGTVYTLTQFDRNGTQEMDLISIPPLPAGSER